MTATAKAAATTAATTTTATTTTAATTAATAAEPGCRVVAAGRAGRAWLPWARVAAPGARLLAVDVVTGAARADLHTGTVVVQRTARRSPAAAVPVELEVLLVDHRGAGVRTCTVDLGRPVPMADRVRGS